MTRDTRPLPRVNTAMLHLRPLAILVLAAIGVAACGAQPLPSPDATPSPMPIARTPPATPSPSPTRSPSPTPEATTQLSVKATMTERCGSIGGCAAYLIIRPHESDAWPAIALLGREAGADSIPTAIAPGRYAFHFSWRAVSDDIARGHPPDETILDTCDVEVVAGTFGTNPQGIEVVAEFHGATCEAEAFHTVTIID